MEKFFDFSDPDRFLAILSAAAVFFGYFLRLQEESNCPSDRRTINNINTKEARRHKRRETYPKPLKGLFEKLVLLSVNSALLAVINKKTASRKLRRLLVLLSYLKICLSLKLATKILKLIED